MKKLGLIFFLVIIVITTSVYGKSNSYTPILNNGYYIVTKVFDGEALEVKNPLTDDISLIKLIGINTKSYDDAYLYMNNSLMGKSVYLKQSHDIYPTSGRWSLVYLVYNGINYNEELVRLGYAEATKATASNDDYAELANIEDTAKINHLGMWEDDDFSNYYYANAININTASRDELLDSISSLRSSVARNIEDYRKYNPFNEIKEIKFVSDFSYYVFNENKNIMHVSTNINEADSTEINSLDGISDNRTEDILEYRADNGNITWSELEDDNIISYDQYKDNKDYVSTKNLIWIDKTIGDDSVNINLASERQIDLVGFLSKEADFIYDYLEKGYTLKTKEEIMEIDDLDMSITRFNQLEDNFNVMTDINNCSEYEVRSLFGDDYSKKEVEKIIDERPYRSIEDIEDIIGSKKYKLIKDYIYVDNYTNNFVNINTATKDQLMDIGMSDYDANKILNSSFIDSYDEIPTNISELDKSITLYTNINKAKKEELMTLHTDMTNGLAEEIIRYSNTYLFASDNELKEFLRKQNKGNLYNDLVQSIVYR